MVLSKSFQCSRLQKVFTRSDENCGFAAFAKTNVSYIKKAVFRGNGEFFEQVGLFVLWRREKKLWEAVQF